MLASGNRSEGPPRVYARDLSAGLGERGSVFTDGPAPCNPYALQFSRCCRAILSQPSKSGNGRNVYAKARNVHISENCLLAFFLTLLGNELLTAFFESPGKNGLTSFGAPDEMVDNQVDAVLISLVLELARVCRCHSDSCTAIST
jgi:hypothetical protein